ncbi:MAG: protein serine/threonine phosphatase [Bacteroidetes bacterium]|nr:MAG: protein serine/threonine phosphatase [Bacteroidota bacterium]
MRVPGFILTFFLLFVSASAQIDSAAFERSFSGKPAHIRAKMLDSVALKLMGSAPDKALDYVNREIDTRQLIDDKTWEGQSYGTKAKIYRRLGDLDATIEFLEKSLASYKAAGNDTGICDYHINMGNVYLVKNDFARTTFHYSEGLKISERLNTSGQRAMCLSNMGNVYFYQQEFDKAVEYYEKSIELNESIGDLGAASLSRDNIALVYDQQGKYDKAISYHLQAIRDMKKRGNKSLIAETMIATGGHYNMRKMIDSSFYYYNEALRYAEESDYLVGKASALFNIADLTSQQGKYTEAEVIYRKALIITEKGNLTSFAVEVYQNLSKLFEQEGRVDSALKYSKLHAVTKDTLYNENKAKQLSNFRTRFEMGRKEREIELINKDREKDRIQFYASLTGIGLLLILVVIILRSSVQRKKINKLLAIRNEEISAKNKDITDSINYAKRIQAAVLPDEKILSEAVKEIFILNRPRDIVSGDFYWFARKNNFLYIAAADCTGHGVPGALVSVVGINALQQLIEQDGTPDTSALLGKLHRQVILAMNKDVNLRETQDGMDIGLVRIDLASRAAQFSGAGRPLFYMTEGEEKIRQIGSDRSSIAGVKLFDDTTPYTLHELKLEKQTTFYLFSDGIVDQFGGPGGHSGGKKFLTRRLVELLENARNLPLAGQHKKIEKEMDAWRGDYQQTDDMLMIGFTV